MRDGLAPLARNSGESNRSGLDGECLAWDAKGGRRWPVDSHNWHDLWIMSTGPSARQAAGMKIGPFVGGEFADQAHANELGDPAANGHNSWVRGVAARTNLILCVPGSEMLARCSCRRGGR